jgi:hypothetical protein
MTTTSTIDRAGLSAVVRQAVHDVRYAAHFGLNSDMALGPRSAISEVGPAFFNRFGGAHRVAPGSIDTRGLLTHP